MNLRAWALILALPLAACGSEGSGGARGGSGDKQYLLGMNAPQITDEAITYEERSSGAAPIQRTARFTAQTQFYTADCQASNKAAFFAGSRGITLVMAHIRVTASGERFIEGVRPAPDGRATLPISGWTPSLC
jgi:hypothetical protein